MPPERPVLIVFHGGMGGSDIEDELSRALGESGLDLIDEALTSGAFEGALLVSDSDALASRLPAGAALDVDTGPFHFGERLAAIVRERGLRRPVYAGAGGVPLLRGSDLAAIARHLEAEDNIVISNNYFSADLVAFAPGEAIERIDLPGEDNFLPRLLHEQAGLESRPLPRGTATQYNIDSPADLAVLKYAAGASPEAAPGPRLGAFLESFDADLGAYRRLARVLVDPKAELLVAGRVGSQVWPYLETETACRLRVVSEERGMRAAGRDAPGAARSLLAFHVQEVGCERFFGELAELCDAAVIDTRPLLSHLGVKASRPDRFWSDLGRPERIEEPFLRSFTAGAVEAAVPVVLGGHSLVAGGLILLNEAAWAEEDRRA